MLEPSVIRKIFFTIQKLFIAVSLFMVYFLCLAVTWLLILIFDRKRLKGANRRGRTFWAQAIGYEPDLEDCLRQS